MTRPSLPTTAQVAAMIRNHKILRLRGAAVAALIDAELIALGATIEPKGHLADE